MLLDGPEEFGAQPREESQTDDLEDKTGNHDVDAGVCQRFGIGGIGDGTADRLQNEGEDVAADEDDGVGPRLEAGEGSAVGDDYTGEGEVDGGGEETGGYC